jgi:hypothetical protein
MLLHFVQCELGDKPIDRGEQHAFVAVLSYRLLILNAVLIATLLLFEYCRKSILGSRMESLRTVFRVECRLSVREVTVLP